MRVALFGGTGFVGGYLVDALLAAGHQPVVLARESSDKKVKLATRCTLVRGDIGSISAIEATLKDCDAAIYCIGILREAPSKGITFRELQENGAIRVVDAAARLGVGRLLLMSANGVKVPGTPYQETKYRAEQYALASPLKVTVLRPSVIFGDPRGLTEFATQLHRQMIAPPLPAVEFYTGASLRSSTIVMSPVHVADVADAFVGSMGAASTVGKTFTLGGKTTVSWGQILRIIAQAAGKPRKLIVPMPIGLMKLAATLLDWLPVFPATRDQLMMLEEGNVALPSVIESLIDRPAKGFTVANLAYLTGNLGSAGSRGS